MRQDVNAQTRTGSAKHRLVVLNTDTLAALGAPGYPVGPISSEGHSSCSRSRVTSAGLLWMACQCKCV